MQSMCCECQSPKLSIGEISSPQMGALDSVVKEKAKPNTRSAKEKYTQIHSVKQHTATIIMVRVSLVKKKKLAHIGTCDRFANEKLDCTNRSQILIDKTEVYMQYIIANNSSYDSQKELAILNKKKNHAIFLSKMRKSVY